MAHSVHSARRGAAWRCYLRLPPGHKWEQVARDELSFLRCTRCGKEKWPPGSNPAAEESIKAYARGWGAQ
jgi:hypothetical protein